MSRLRFAFLLTCLSWALVAPRLWKSSTNIVTGTYQLASQRAVSGRTPYEKIPPQTNSDVFKYSPAFGFLYAPIEALPNRLEALVWAFLNAFIFWFGLLQWFHWKSFRPKFLAVGVLILASMELDGSLHYQQINALLVGLLMIGVARFRDLRLVPSGALLALATNLKLLPALFVGFLLFPLRKPFLKGLISVSLPLLLIPSLRVGVLAGIEWHWQWFKVILADTRSPGLFDVQSVLERFSFGPLAKIIRLGILTSSLVFLFYFRPQKRGPADFWNAWLALGLTTLLLCSPRTESPTFVLMAPCYVLLAAELLAMHSKVPERNLLWGLYLIGAFFVSLSYNDLWPKALWNPARYLYNTKTLGVLPFWFLSAWLLKWRNAKFQKSPVLS